MLAPEQTTETNKKMLKQWTWANKTYIAYNVNYPYN